RSHNPIYTIMNCTLEISMYPLDQAYESIVLEFLRRLRTHTGIQIETNGVSTQIFGDYTEVMSIVQEEMKASLIEGKAIFVMKVAGGTLRYRPEAHP
ncbi:MAG: YkoF family thiamine/hydroxymethylpyrimidine-binding protein, partial [Bacteroidota bacterium]